MLWLGQVVSLFGDWFNLIASAALIPTLTESEFAVGGLFMVRMPRCISDRGDGRPKKQEHTNGS